MLYCSRSVRTLRLAKELGGWTIVKLEVLADDKTLYPNMIETINAAEKLISDGFKVMAYCNDDPILCKILEETGCSAIMPLRISNRFRLRNFKSIKYKTDN